MILGVGVFVLVGVWVGVTEGVGVTVWLAVILGVGVGVLVDVLVGVWVKVGVGVDVRAGGTKDVQYPLLFNQVYASYTFGNVCPAIDSDSSKNELSVKNSDLKNPTYAGIPTGFGWSPNGTGWAITYPRSSSGPFQNCGALVNPDNGEPMDKSPSCSVPGIVDPVLYAKGLAVAIIY